MAKSFGITPGLILILVGNPAVGILIERVVWFLLLVLTSLSSIRDGKDKVMQISLMACFFWVFSMLPVPLNPESLG